MYLVIRTLRNSDPEATDSGVSIYTVFSTAAIDTFLFYVVYLITESGLNRPFSTQFSKPC